MDTFRSAHLSASKKLKRRKAFKKKVKKLILTEDVTSKKKGHEILTLVSKDVKPSFHSRRRGGEIEIQYLGSSVTSALLQSDDRFGQSVSLLNNDEQQTSKLEENVSPTLSISKTKGIDDDNDPKNTSIHKRKKVKHKRKSKEYANEKSFDIGSGDFTNETSNIQESDNCINSGTSELPITANIASNSQPSPNFGREMFSQRAACLTSTLDHSNHNSLKFPCIDSSEKEIAGKYIRFESGTSEAYTLEDSISSAHLKELSEKNVQPLVIENDERSPNSVRNHLAHKFEYASIKEAELNKYTINCLNSLWNVVNSFSFENHSRGGTPDIDLRYNALDPVIIMSETESPAATSVIKKLQQLPFRSEETQHLNIIKSIRNSLSPLKNAVHGGQESKFAPNLFDSCNGVSAVEFYALPKNRYLLSLKNDTSLFFRGKISVSVLAGRIDILGFVMKPNPEMKRYTAYSPRGVSLLSLRACNPSDHDLDIKSDLLKLLGADDELIERLCDKTDPSDCLLCLEKADSVTADYLSIYVPNNLFPITGLGTTRKHKFSIAEKKLQCEFLQSDTEENVKLYSKRDEWDDLFETILSRGMVNGNSCTMLCGGKGVGKSTLLRYFINKSLDLYERILCIDLDPGQAEFTVPGCVSAVVVESPLLGPNFTHLKTPERMVYIGEVDVSRCPTRYLDAAKYIINHCRAQPQFQSIPWFVNTMGFCKGLGVELMVNLISLLSPTHLVQIESQSRKRNFPKQLQPDYVHNYKGCLKYISNRSSVLNYEVFTIPSAAESEIKKEEAEWGLDSRSLREIVVMAYLSTMIAPPKYSLTSVVPYICSFKDLKLCVSHEIVNPNKILSVMNGNLVGLCVYEGGRALLPNSDQLPHVLLTAPVCQCLGFGIVRGIDMEKRQLFLISPLPESEICRVNCLVMGAVQIPNSVLLKTAAVGRVPYTVLGSGQPTGRPSHKSSCHLLLSSAPGL